MRAFLLTIAALIAFAANSVLARIGLTLGEIGPSWDVVDTAADLQWWAITSTPHRAVAIEVVGRN